MNTHCKFLVGLFTANLSPLPSLFLSCLSTPFYHFPVLPPSAETKKLEPFSVPEFYFLGYLVAFSEAISWLHARTLSS